MDSIEDTNELFIERAKDLLSAKKLKQKDLVERCGYTSSGISNLLQNGSKNLVVLKVLSELTNVSVDYYLGVKGATLDVVDKIETTSKDEYNLLSDIQKEIFSNAIQGKAASGSTPKELIRFSAKLIEELKKQ